VLGRLRVEQKNWQWVRPENLHLTLKFLGPTSPLMEEAILEHIDLVAGRSFMLPVEELGAFPSLNRPQVVWAGLGGGHPELFGLQKRLEDHCFNLGIPPEKRRYQPHITVARVSQAHPETIRQFLKAHRDFSAPPFRVEAFHLYRSELQDHHRVYIKEATWPLLDERLTGEAVTAPCRPPEGPDTTGTSPARRHPEGMPLLAAGIARCWHLFKVIAGGDGQPVVSRAARAQPPAISWHPAGMQKARGQRGVRGGVVEGRETKRDELASAADQNCPVRHSATWEKRREAPHLKARWEAGGWSGDCALPCRPRRGRSL